MKNVTKIKKSATRFMICAVIAVGTIGTVSGVSYASPTNNVAIQMVDKLPSGDFVQKQKRLKGGYEVVQENGQTIIRFNKDFKTSNGPDLKIFLSPQTIDTATGSTATQGAVLLGLIKSTRGTQDYIIPKGVNLSDFGSVLIHCEAYSVLWGGGNL